MDIFFMLFMVISLFGGTYIFLQQQKKIRLEYEEKLTQKSQQLENERILRHKAEAELTAREKQFLLQEQHLKESFTAASASAMETGNKIFLQLANQTFEKYFNTASSEQKNSRQELELILSPLKEALNKQENLVKVLEQNSNKTFGSIKTYIEALVESQTKLQKETTALVGALKSPKVRGRWGEIGLRRIVEFSGLSSYCDFQEQVNTHTENASLRPDLIVNLPDNKKIVVDSKMPLAAFLDALETDNEKEKAIYIASHARAVAQHVKDLSQKSYWQQFQGAVDFVVLYIEVEPALGMALTENKNLIAEAIQNRIVFATPTTLVALLQTVAFTWKQHTATENAVAIWNNARELYNRLIIFTEHLQKTGIQLNATVKSYNQAIASWESRVIPAIKRLEEKGIDSSKKEIPQLNDVETLTRQFRNEEN